VEGAKADWVGGGPCEKRGDAVSKPMRVADLKKLETRNGLANQNRPGWERGEGGADETGGTKKTLNLRRRRKTVGGIGNKQKNGGKGGGFGEGSPGKVFEVGVLEPPKTISNKTGRRASLAMDL